MITVPEAARRVGRDPETIRRWIRTGRLPAAKVGTQHVIEERDLDELLADDVFPVPDDWGWGQLAGPRPMPNVVAVIRRQRAGH